MRNIPEPYDFLFLVGYGENKWTAVTSDALLVSACLGLMLIVSFPGYGTINNIFYRTSEVLKLKAEKTKGAKADEQPEEERMTVEEVLDFIYGKNRTISQIIFACFY